MLKVVEFIAIFFIAKISIYTILAITSKIGINSIIPIFITMVTIVIIIGKINLS